MAGHSRSKDAALVQELGRHQVHALRDAWDRYACATHWICVLYEQDQDLAASHLEAIFLDLWSSSPGALAARPLPEQLAAAARRRCRSGRPDGQHPSRTIARLDRLSDVELAGVALIFSGKFSANDASETLSIDQCALGRSLRTVLVEDVDGAGAARSTR